MSKVRVLRRTVAPRLIIKPTLSYQEALALIEAHQTTDECPKSLQKALAKLKKAIHDHDTQ